MSHFEFVYTGFSFLVALMLGRLLKALAQLDFKSADKRHTAWLVVLIIHSMLFWWLGWRYHDLDFSVHKYFALLTPALILFFTISVLTPDNEPKDWAQFFESRRKRFFGSYTLFWVVLGLAQYVISNEIRPSVAPLLLSVLGASFSNKFVQWGVLVLMGTVFLLLAFVFPENVTES
jgi:hypothetical protein